MSEPTDAIGHGELIETPRTFGVTLNVGTAKPTDLNAVVGDHYVRVRSVAPDARFEIFLEASGELDISSGNAELRNGVLDVQALKVREDETTRVEVI